MPTLLRWNGYRFFFYSADGWEPPHVHIANAGREAKLWLHTELGQIIRKAREEREAFLEAWNDHFANRG